MRRDEQASRIAHRAQPSPRGAGRHATRDKARSPIVQTQGPRTSEPPWRVVPVHLPPQFLSKARTTAVAKENYRDHQEAGSGSESEVVTNGLVHSTRSLC